MVRINKMNEALSDALNTLHAGGLVICPSDTVYGVLVDAKNAQAVEKLIAFKNRPPGKPISVFLPSLESVQDYVKADGKQEKTVRELLPGPFTIILPSTHRIDPRLESERGTLGIRLPDYRFIAELASRYGSPLTATSANLSGRPPHYSLETLLRELPAVKADLIGLAVDAGKLPRNKPSTVIDLSGSQLKIVRHGDVVSKRLKSYLTGSAAETEKTARYLVNRYLEKGSGECLVFILEGDMGAGKTVFVKGAAGLFGVDAIISPTFVVSYEYDVTGKNIHKLIHADLFNIEDASEFPHLGLEEYLKPGHLLFIEWGEKAGQLYGKLRQKARVIHISMNYLAPTEREIIVHE